LTFIYADESGEPGLNGRRFFTIGYICCENPNILSRFLRLYLKTIKHINQYPIELKELKFKLPKQRLRKFGYNDTEIQQFDIFMETIRLRVLSIINRFSDNIFAVVVDKQSVREKTWTAERLCNYVFATTLQEDILNLINIQTDPILYYDAGRLNQLKEIEFNQYLVNKELFRSARGLKRYRGTLWSINSIESHIEPCIWAADFIAGAYYDKYVFNNHTYVDAIDIRKFVGNGLRIYWENQTTI
jgi:Protein of unknown function (DUF3800)